jgi:Electron transfer DM13
MKIWKGLIPVVVVALFVAWYEFRPERLVVNKRVHEELPAVQGSSPDQILASGTFHSILHATSGTATIYRVRDGTRVLRFTNFKTSNGPDVHVYMVAANDATDNAAVERAGFIDLGIIKGNIGDQNYALGPDVDLSKYRAVSVWCKRFSVNFGTAPLLLNQAICTRSRVRSLARRCLCRGPRQINATQG